MIVQLLTHLSCKIDASSHCLGVFAAEVCIILESASSGSLREACHCQDCMLVTWVVRWIWCRCRGMEPGQFQQTFFCAVLCNEFSPRYKITQKQCQTTLCTHYGRPCIHSSIEFSVDMSIHRPRHRNTCLCQLASSSVAAGGSGPRVWAFMTLGRGQWWLTNQGVQGLDRYN